MTPLDLTLLITIVRGDHNNNWSFLLCGKFLQKEICGFHCLSHGNMLCKGSRRLSWYFFGEYIVQGESEILLGFFWGICCARGVGDFLRNLLCKGSRRFSWDFFGEYVVQGELETFLVFFGEYLMQGELETFLVFFGEFFVQGESKTFLVFFGEHGCKQLYDVFWNVDVWGIFEM